MERSNIKDTIKDIEIFQFSTKQGSDILDANSFLKRLDFKNELVKKSFFDRVSIFHTSPN